jgi:hypothetical protein
MMTQGTQVTDAMVEAAARVMYGKNWHEWNDQRVPLNRCRATIHAALSAALAVSGEREALTQLANMAARVPDTFIDEMRVRSDLGRALAELATLRNAVVRFTGGA